MIESPVIVKVQPTDEELAEFLKLQKEVKKKSERMSEIRQRCKEIGSFCTENHAVVVYMQEQRRLVGLEEMLKAYTLKELEDRDLIKVIDFEVVKIATRIVPE